MNLGLIPVNRASESHLQQIMSWRNDPGTRIHFFHTEPKQWPAYRDEFIGHYAKAPLPPYFVCNDGVPCGFLAFRNYAEKDALAAPVHASVVSIDLLIAPEARGRGVGSWALEQVPGLAAETSVGVVVGEVKTSNAASLKIFDRSPLKRLDTFKKHVSDTGETHAVVRYVWKKA